MAKSAPAKSAPKAPPKKAPAKTAATAEVEATETKHSGMDWTVSDWAIAVSGETEAETVEEPTREAPAMEAAGEPTDFDNLLDLARAVDPKFGSETSKEGTQHFMIRLLTALVDSTTEQFESLPVSAQTWYENAVAQGNEKQDISPPDGYVAPSVAAPAAAKKKAASEKKAAAAKTPREPKTKKEPKVREASKTYPIRLLVCKNPKITLDELVALLPNAGKTTLSTLRSDTLAALKAAQECGWSAPA